MAAGEAETEADSASSAATTAAMRAVHASADGAPSASSGRDAWQRFGPVGIVALAVGFGLVLLHKESGAVAYANDSAMHEQMVRFAAAQLRLGHFPIDSWYPYLGLGSPHLQDYQGLPATITGLFGLAVGANTAFSWSTYLLLGCFPVSIYCSARLFGLGRFTAAAGALVAPLLRSVPGAGYEYSSYLWLGYGLWTQLWAMVSLPIAWGLTWRAIDRGRFLGAAAALIALTIALHFMTGYEAVLALLVLPWLRRRELWRRCLRSILVGIGALLLASVVIVPVFLDRNETAINEFAQHTFYADSFGAPKVLGWLVSGQLFDAGRFPIVTILVGIGIVACAVRARRDPPSRALLALFVACLLVFFGRPTWGPLFDLVPGARNLWLRRSVIGVDLAAMLLAGTGAVTLARLCLGLADRRVPRWSRSAALGLGGLAVGLGALAPAWVQVGSEALWDGRSISLQQKADTSKGAQLAALVEKARTLGPGRMYAGLPTNWGKSFRVGSVPVYIYLARLDVDEVGFTLRTESLESNPEAHFDEHEAGDFSMFGVRYLILPTGRTPPVAAERELVEGHYSLWMIRANTYWQVVSTIGSLSENASDVGAATTWLLDSTLPARQEYLTVAFDGRPAARTTRSSAGAAISAAGSVRAQRDDLVEGRASATIVANSRAVALLSVSYDSGWTATVDGRAARVEMLAPALMGVSVGPGVHRVVFVWHSYGDDPQLVGLSGAAALGFAAMAVAARRRRARRRRLPDECLADP